MKFSDKCLFDALVKIMKTKKLADISITELTETAGVSRTTFYRNYNYPEDILKKYLVATNIGLDLPENPADFDLRTSVSQYFDFMVAESELLINLLNSGLDHIFFDVVDEICSGALKPYLESVGFKTGFEISGFVGMVYKASVDWIKDGMPDPEGCKKIAYRMCIKPENIN